MIVVGIDVSKNKSTIAIINSDYSIDVNPEVMYQMKRYKIFMNDINIQEEKQKNFNCIRSQINFRYDIITLEKENI